MINQRAFAVRGIICRYDGEGPSFEPDASPFTRRSLIPVEARLIEASTRDPSQANPAQIIQQILKVRLDQSLNTGPGPGYHGRS